MGILDAATERVQNRFAAMVESVRIGTVIAHDKRAAGRWQRSAAASRTPPLTGDALERAVMEVASIYPDHVIRIPAA